jgi:hypothetical protein
VAGDSRGPAPRPRVSSASPSPARPAAAPPAAPDWKLIRYPLDCDGFGVVLMDSQDGLDFTGDGRPEAVRLVRCNAGAGSPPSVLYAFTAQRDGTPRLLQTLLRPSEDLLVNAFYTEDGQIYGPADGCSSDDVPRCCPDVQKQLTWE